MYKTVLIFDSQFTNSQNTWKINKKTAKLRFYLFWQGHLCNSRVDFVHKILLFGKDVKTFLQNL